MDELNKVLNENERITWKGKPNFKAYYIKGLLSSLIPAIFLLIILIPFIYVGMFSPMTSVTGTTQTDGFVKFFRLGMTIFLIPFILIALWLLIGVPIYKIINYKKIFYAITNERVIIQGGIIGRDFKYIDFEQISNVQVNVGFWDKMVGKNSGSIIINSTGYSTPKILRNIDSPYEVFKLLKKVDQKNPSKTF